MTINTCRKYALGPLLRDFEERCAYSRLHLSRGQGTRCMEIDHFDPATKSVPTQAYESLYLASRHCNGAKGDTWPSPEEQDAGLRFLDCCTEQDYGVHILEDTSTGLLYGTTPAGTYHIEVLELNAPFLVRERQERTQWLQLLKGTPVVARMGTDVNTIGRCVDLMQKTVRDMIPPTPCPGSAQDSS